MGTDGSGPGSHTGENRSRFYRRSDFNNNYYLLTKVYGEPRNLSPCFLWPKAYRPDKRSNKYEEGLEALRVATEPAASTASSETSSMRINLFIDLMIR